MESLIWLGGISFGLSLILTPIFRDVFRSYGVVDTPDQGRKTHKYPIPRVGGIAIAISYVATFFLVPSHTGSVLHEQLSLVWKLLPAAGVIFAVGIIDDLFGLKPWQKLLGQLGGASLAFWAGVRISVLVGYPTENWWSIPVTILWLLACTNAFNLVDGMDGLAAGVGLFATLTIFIAALLHQSAPLAMATFPLAGCLLGFLCYNFNPATIFLGDSGSLLIGFLLGCYGIIWTQKSATILGMTAPLMALSIPLLDVSISIVRRFLNRQPIFSADRGHIHHKLLDRGLTPRRAALLIYGLSSIVACFSLLQSMMRSDRISGLIIIIFCAVAWIGIQYLGYVEFSIAGKMLFSGDLQRTLKAQLDLHGFEKSLRSAHSLEDCWQVLEKSSSTFGCELLRFEVEGRLFKQNAGSGDDTEYWTFSVPLPERSQVTFRRNLQSTVLSAIVGPFVESVSSTLGPKLTAICKPASAAEPGALQHTGLAR